MPGVYLWLPWALSKYCSWVIAAASLNSIISYLGHKVSKQYLSPNSHWGLFYKPYHFISTPLLKRSFSMPDLEKKPADATWFVTLSSRWKELRLQFQSIFGQRAVKQSNWNHPNVTLIISNQKFVLKNVFMENKSKSFSYWPNAASLLENWDISK